LCNKLDDDEKKIAVELIKLKFTEEKIIYMDIKYINSEKQLDIIL